VRELHARYGIRRPAARSSAILRSSWIRSVDAGLPRRSAADAGARIYGRTNVLGHDADAAGVLIQTDAPSTGSRSRMRSMQQATKPRIPWRRLLYANSTYALATRRRSPVAIPGPNLR
jgi:hypothetical protein